MPCTPEVRSVTTPSAWLVAVVSVALSDSAHAEEPLHVRIDRLILAKADGGAVSPPADDAEFLRRAWLDVAGTIPPADTLRAFLSDTSPDKRSKAIDSLLAAPTYPRRMADLFHVMLMERTGDHAAWSDYLRESFAANKPWDRMAREILRADPKDDANRGAAFFLAKRLEKYGENPIDYPGLARDAGRLFVGVDLRCAQGHDHLFIPELQAAGFPGPLRVRSESDAAGCEAADCRREADD